MTCANCITSYPRTPDVPLPPPQSMIVARPSRAPQVARLPALAIALALAGTLAVPRHAQAQTVTELRVPMQYPAASPGASGDVHTTLFATEFRPRGPGPYPLVIISHGMPRSPAERLEVTGRYHDQSLEFVRRGFIVINPVRRGYGKTGGPFLEGNASCAAPGYYASGLESARDLAATIDYARTRTDIDTTRILLVGQSAGGFASLAAASLAIDGVRGVISFAGGRGSRGPGDVCAEERLVDAFAHFAETTRVPTLWFYAENDLYFGPALVRRIVATYRDRGGQVDYRPQPAYGNDGHAFFSATTNVPLWSRELDRFLAVSGMTPPRLVVDNGAPRRTASHH